MPDAPDSTVLFQDRYSKKRYESHIYFHFALSCCHSSENKSNKCK